MVFSSTCSLHSLEHAIGLQIYMFRTVKGLQGDGLQGQLFEGLALQGFSESCGTRLQTELEPNSFARSCHIGRGSALQNMGLANRLPCKASAA